MMHALLVTLLAGLPVLPQDPPAESPPPVNPAQEEQPPATPPVDPPIELNGRQAAPAEDASWQTLDHVVCQAGDRVITLSDVVRHYESMRRRLNLEITTPAEREEALDRALEALVVLALESQAGEDKEASPEDVEHLLDRFLDRTQRDRGLVDYVEDLERQGLSAHSERDRQRSGFYTSQFRDQGLSGPRPTRDGYVRPGELRRVYSAESQRRAEPDQVRLRELQILVDAIGGVEPARELAYELYARLVAGEDFEPIHAEYGASYRPTKGRTELLPVERLPPDVAKFARTAEVGDVSDVMALGPSADDTRAFRIVVLDEKHGVTPLPQFTDPKIQAEIRERIKDARDDAWLAVARARLREIAYLWPAPAAPAPEASAPEASEGSEAPNAPAPAAPEATGEQPAADPAQPPPPAAPEAGAASDPQKDGA